MFPATKRVSKSTFAANRGQNAVRSAGRSARLVVQAVIGTLHTAHLHRLVGDGELAQVVADHVRLDFDL